MVHAVVINDLTIEFSVYMIKIKGSERAIPVSREYFLLLEI
jgi:hypothetical protein